MLDVVILGGGLSGLSAGYALSKKKKLVVCEKAASVGGLAKTVAKDGFRFDLGGHRFFTKNKRVETFVKDLLGGELIAVPRSSKIYFRKKYFDYPLKPGNAFFGMGIFTSAKILVDYSFETLKNSIRKPKIVSLEDWVVSKFGRTMFNLYFRTYSEKVWGIGCDKVCAEWVEQRIRGMSLKAALKNAFFKSKESPTTLIDEFAYPTSGIGRIAERLKEEIEKDNQVLSGAEVVRVNHEDSKITSVAVDVLGATKVFEAENFISSIPAPDFVNMLNPKPPKKVQEAAKKLRYRSLVTVNLMIDRERVTDVKWIYIHDPEIPFGRIHEPKNWSAGMAPDGKTSLVAEYFCFEGDKRWSASNSELVDLTVAGLEKLGFMNRENLLGSLVLRIKNAYPLYEVGYAKHLSVVQEYISRFKNLQSIGREGKYRYFNMDHTIEDGLKAAEAIALASATGLRSSARNTTYTPASCRKSCYHNTIR